MASNPAEQDLVPPIPDDTTPKPAPVEEDETDDTDSLEYVETEPVLAYARMKNDATEILQKDSLSCIRAGHKIIVIGTHWGQVYIMDHDGNKIISKDSHLSTVNDVTIDLKEEYVASCGDDGNVIIFGLCESSHDQKIEFNRPIKCVELEPTFTQTFNFVTGDDKLVLSEKSFLGRRKTSILHEGEGMIRNIKCSDELIAWSNDKVTINHNFF
jgi:vacuolar protein sorting-associated protein 41